MIPDPIHATAGTGGSLAQDPYPHGKRGAERDLVPIGVSVSLTLSPRQSVFVNVRDVSATGACVVRHGDLTIEEDDNVVVEARNHESGASINLRSRVRWVRHTGSNTYVGLSFIGSPLSPRALLKLFA
jgi:hypothetical protein